MAELQNNNKIIPNSPISGMNMDNIPSQLKDGQVTYALNAVIENFDGNEVNYQNEQSNIFCTELKDGYQVIGRHTIPEQNKTIYFLANPTTGESEIGYKYINDCTYTTIINAACLNFSINYPILKIAQKTTDCSTQLFWTDVNNDRRWIDLDELPYESYPDPNNEGQYITTDVVDCNKILVQPNFSIPTITPIAVEVGGSVKEGAYQFAIEYANSLGQAYTSMYGFTNPMGIFDKDKVSMNFDLETSQAIQIEITNLDTTGLYDYFNLIVIKTINGIPTPYRVSNNKILSDTFSTIYTGDDPSEIALAYADVFNRFEYYEVAGDVTSSDNVLIWSQLKKKQKRIYQEIWTNTKLYWQSYIIPVNTFEGYTNSINTGLYRSYLRDENYLFYGVFILKNGKITEKFPIPGRAIKTQDTVSVSNSDALNFNQNPCDDAEVQPYWKVYNTASVSGYTEEYLANTEGSCYKGSYQYGEFGYYESTETYPNNSDIYGSLAGQPILLHKFPDCAISPHYSYDGTDYFIYPMGVTVDRDSLYSAIKNSSLTDEEKDEIVDFKIIRANRATQKSIRAKGLFYNVGKYTQDNQDIFYPNYPYNDLRADPFISKSKVTYNSGENTSTLLEGFADDDSKTRYNFYSPDTLFYQPYGIDSGYVKMETIEYGKSKGHFVQVFDAAKYQFMSTKALQAAFGVAMSAMVSLDSGGGILGVAPSATLMPGNVPGAFLNMLNIIKNIIPFVNYSWQFNSIGEYNQTYAVPNEGNKIRQIDTGSYLISGYQSVGGERINNFRRESSVYLRLTGTLPFVSEYSDVPEDTSRYLLSAGKTEDDFDYEAYADQTGEYWDSLTSAQRETLFYYRESDVYTNIDNYTQALSDLGIWDRTWEQMNVDSTTTGYRIINGIRDNALIVYVQDVLLLDVSGQTANCTNPGLLTKTDISTYYGSIKRVINDQYGKINSVDCIDTGFQHRLWDDDGNEYDSFPTIFGGDTFITRFALKRKHSFFLDNTATKPNGADIALNVLGNVGYPVYFYSTDQIDATFSTTAIDSYLGLLVNFSAGNVIGNIVSGGTRPVIAGMKIMASIFKGYVDVLGVPNVNLDCYEEKNLNVEGKAYLFSYGIPYFFVESDVNTDYRQAYNSKEGDFYPHVGTDIPDYWLQENNVSIVQDNTYVYNKSYSKQNKEIYFDSLRADFDVNKICLIDFPNRAIYSEKSNMEETKNNWLVYRPLSYYDFPKMYGSLVSLDGIESRAVLARFENKSQIYNVLTTVNTSTGTGYLGNPTMFSQPPVDFAETDTGYAGSQNKLLLKTEGGHLFVDSLRGQIFLLRGSQVQEISNRDMSHWFTENLPFNILKYFPNYNTDNHYKDIGLTGVYDTKYTRYIITKRDYIPLNDNITYDSETFKFYLNDTEVSITDSTYFCDKSWTISYSMKTQSWVSYHSYIPNYYVAASNGYFETGNNNGTYIHNKAITFNNFYGTICPYIVEYPIKMLPDEEIISNFQDYTTVLKYSSDRIYYEVESGVYFNQAIVYNDAQNSGLLNLIEKPKNNLSSYRKYPKFNTDSKDILYSKSDGLFKFNTFWDIVKDRTKPCFSTPCNLGSVDKELDDTNLDYTTRSHQKSRLRSREARVRLIYNSSDEYKLISKFFLTNTQKSNK